ncbi:hypothetical protein FHX81_4181 [Saccharothrix saharensis]|uniref:Uncharacterized protein n=1 Tax=Saccharothrix saharensis TaxID=571190 RepID=A0A543JG19_9PSEU|nr:hypothetical protein [Saccharothrix saharensis]TQM81797.1 hypothetical protein FHX81_4181 [Saccharothrix saharensis]
MTSSEARKTRTLVLHLAANPNPISIRLTPDAAADLEPRLVQVVRNGHTHAVATVDGHEFVVNFAHVVAAHFA